MLPNLTANEARVIGCLMEKSVITPDQYPLTLNALTSACNQKSSRDPVMGLEQSDVQRTARDLASRHLVRIDENFKSGVVKYRQRLCNTMNADYQLDAGEFSIVCLLLLRGPQTPGKLRSHSGRLHTFEDNSAVVATLNALVEREGGPLVIKLPRVPGRKDSEYMHLLSGPVDLEAHAARVQAPVTGGGERIGVAELAERVTRLESELAELKARLGG